MTFLVCIACVLISRPTSPVDSFAAELRALRCLQPQQIGKTELVARYESLIAESESHPDVGLAMLRLGDVYELADPSHGIVREPDVALDWYRRAYDASTTGTDVWRRAALKIVRRTRNGDAADLAESRMILNALEDVPAASPAHQAEILLECALQDIREGRLEDAAARCRSVRNLSANLPNTADESTRVALAGTLEAALLALIEGEVKHVATTGVSRARANLAGLRKEFALSPRVEARVDRFLEKSAVLRTPVDFALSSPQNRPRRFGLLIALNLLLAGGLGLASLLNRRGCVTTEQRPPTHDSADGQ